MSFDKDKFKALVLHVIWRTSHIEGFGATKLNKALWFSEARVFEAYGKTITGETFVRDQHGPRSKHLRQVCWELEDEGAIEPFVENVHNRQASRYRAHQPADTSMFTAEELAMIDWWVSHIGKEHTATSISNLSHDYGWEVAAMGEGLPLHAYLARRIHKPETDEEIEWAAKEAKRLGLT
jgi:Protein of unknown function (DUF4065)